MAFELQWTERAKREFTELQRRARGGKKSRMGGTYKQVGNALRLLEQNPRHPGLHTHQFHSIIHPWRAGEKVFEAYAQNRTPGAYRIFWCYGPNSGEITIIAITPHP